MRQGIAARTGSVIHRGCSEQEVTPSQLGKCPRAECQEEMLGFENAEVSGKAPRVLTPQDEQRLRGDVRWVSLGKSQKLLGHKVNDKE